MRLQRNAFTRARLGIGKVGRYPGFPLLVARVENQFVAQHVRPGSRSGKPKDPTADVWRRVSLCRRGQSFFEGASPIASRWMSCCPALQCMTRTTASGPANDPGSASLLEKRDRQDEAAPKSACPICVPNTDEVAEVRAATPDDACEVASIHVRAWQVAYRGLLPQEYLDGLRPEDRARGYTFDRTGAEHPAALVAVEHGMICGFVITGLSHDSDLQDARELWAIYVDPQRWGNGIGRSSWRLPEIGFIKTVRARPCFGSSQETLAPGASISSTDGTATGLGVWK